ncbi:hypothetical protein CK203_024927 [Vitis vinifera]|uniref:Uncharacterized protein n=1 Tax=Vitis vinifera TaxID=29760 RepID=A0A438J7B4_VITVI|nr:hypothetical protein CK203_024927 [Vitis vinifera]
MPKPRLLQQASLGERRAALCLGAPETHLSQLWTVTLVVMVCVCWESRNVQSHFHLCRAISCVMGVGAFLFIPEELQMSVAHYAIQLPQSHLLGWLGDSLGGNTVLHVNGPGSTEKKTVTSWELMEVNNGSNGECGEELCLVRTVPHEATEWEEVNWEDSELARFSKFLGFSTKGLEKDILDFLVKIRKRERVHSKVLLDKSKLKGN